MRKYIQQLNAVIEALNAVSVNGKYNLANLGNSIIVLEEVVKEMQIELNNNDDATLGEE
jgi:hypothetical protein